jgi:L-ascorbate metabolism protein UlaG (beta-lactamase superfamily)
MARLGVLLICGVMAFCLLGVMGVRTMLDRIHWLGHDSFRITGDRTIYLDPFQIENGPTADLVLLTHAHRDHCSPDDIAKIAGPKTILVGTADTLEKLPGTKRVIKVGDTLTLGGVIVEAVPAYNIGKAFHPKENGWVGFILTVEGVRIYHAGDTDSIPEMKTFTADIALLPVGGKYTMTAEDAAQAARDIKPKIAVPMHYGSVIGTEDDARRFKDDLQGKIEVVLKTREP